MFYICNTSFVNYTYISYGALFYMSFKLKTYVRVGNTTLAYMSP